MHKKNQLYDLIQGLTRTEKRYFNLFAQDRKKNNNDYLKLFSILNQMKNYDARVFETEVQKAGIHTHIEVKKHYLYELILHALKEYHHHSFEYINSLAYAEILISKKLYLQAYYLLNKRLISIQPQEDFSQEIALIEKQAFLCKHIHKMDEQEIYQKLIAVSNRQKNALEYTLYLNDILRVLAQYSFVRNEKQQKIYKRLLDKPLLKSEMNAQSVTAKLYYNHINYLIHASLGSWKKAYGYAKEMFSLSQSQKIKTESFAIMHLRALSNYMGAILINNNSNAEFNEIARSLKQFIIQTNNQHLKMIAETNHFQFQMIYFIKNKDFKKAIEFAKHSIFFLSKNEHQLDKDKLKYIQFDIAKVFFRTSDYRNAYKWLLKTEFPGASNVSADVFSFSRILSLLCLIKQNETELVPQNGHLLKRQLRQLNILYSYESFLISFITTKLIKLNELNHYQKIELLNEFKDKNKLALKHRWSKNALIYFDFNDWIESELRLLSSNIKLQ